MKIKVHDAAKKRPVKASSKWAADWSARLDQDKGLHYYVLSAPTGTARVLPNNSTGKKYHAEVKFRDGNNRSSVAFEDKYKCMDWAEDILFNYKKIQSSTVEGVRLTDSWAESHRDDINEDVMTKTCGDCEATIYPFDDYEGTTGYNVIIQNRKLLETYENTFENPGALGKAKRWVNKVMSEYNISSSTKIEGTESEYEFPDQISILAYPESDTWLIYDKMYEHEDGGCYYRTKEDNDPITSTHVSLYPDGHLTYLWNGVESTWRAKWKPVDSVSASTKVTAGETWDRIWVLKDKVDKLKKAIADGQAAGDDMIDEQMELAELEDELRFAWAEDEEEYNYAWEQQEFNPDGSLKGYGDVYSSSSISAPDEVPTLDFDDSDILFQVLHHFMDEVEEGDYYNSVRVLDSDDNILYSGSSLEEAEEQLGDYLSCPTESYWVDDKITIVVLTSSSDNYTPSATAGDYSPSNPWDAPGMSIKDFI